MNKDSKPTPGSTSGTMKERVTLRTSGLDSTELPINIQMHGQRGFAGWPLNAVVLWLKENGVCNVDEIVFKQGGKTVAQITGLGGVESV